MRETSDRNVHEALPFFVCSLALDFQPLLACENVLPYHKAAELKEMVGIKDRASKQQVFDD